MPVAAVASMATAAVMTTAIINQQQVPLRAAPGDSARQQAVLWPGEMVEVRGQRMNYLQVYDYRRERAGFVRADQVRRTQFTAAEAPELLAVVRFVRDTPGAEALGIGYAAAYLKAAPAESINGASGVEVLDALGTLADRLARRASSGAPQSKAAEAALSAHLEVASHYGVRFNAYEVGGRMQTCYEGEAFRRVLALPSDAEQRARAALALTRPECMNPELKPLERAALDAWRAEVLDRVETAELPGYLKNRIRLRRASVWSALAFQRTRIAALPEAEKHSGLQGDAGVMAQRALTEFAGVDKAELAEEDAPGYNDAAMRVNASRWAAVPAQSAAVAGKGPNVVTTSGQPGETCVALTDARHDAARPLARRCTYGIVWTRSASANREGNALSLAVQPMEGWREMWVFRKAGGNWSVSVLPPAATNPDIGYAEFAGWVPGGRQMLVAREARGEGKYRRSFELVNLDTLATERRSGDPGALGAFQRWQDPLWKRQTVSVR